MTNRGFLAGARVSRPTLPPIHELKSSRSLKIGLHPCIGMRFAKLELKLIAALFTLVFEYSRVDSHGDPATGPVPEPDRNDLYRSTPIGNEYFFRYQRRAGVAI